MAAERQPISGTVRRGRAGDLYPFRLDVESERDAVVIKMRASRAFVAKGSPIRVGLSKGDALRLIQDIAAALEKAGRKSRPEES